VSPWGSRWPWGHGWDICHEARRLPDEHLTIIDGSGWTGRRWHNRSSKLIVHPLTFKLNGTDKTRPFRQWHFPSVAPYIPCCTAIVRYWPDLTSTDLRHT
jgi:hypothetical protein